MTLAEKITDAKATHAQLRAEPPQIGNLDGNRVAYDQGKAVLDECSEAATHDLADDGRKSVQQAANRLAADAAIAAGLESEHAGVPRDEDFLGYYATLEAAFGDQS